MEETIKKPRGFAAMSPEKQREICVKGGRAAQAGGKAHRFTAEEARAAGKKGGVKRRGEAPPEPEPEPLTDNTGCDV